ncbi:glycoside hydrolase family 30 protein [Winogradskyella litoriviva]|uniref:Glycoside hydrolase family 30 protein n=1 Tax=Winogradskyella litoriviva TaxID=1220182 RepID=A0ABX2E5N9_9FLAO|nr:glycoside hydrolase family 30 protein [Winogradskyella litoriviva]NRD23627.1 glycoside hydrolase family 30 protein [Winogradskyella litoriviva]
MIKKIIFTLTISLLICSCNKDKKSNDKVDIDSPKTEEAVALLGKEVQVYTTAENTDKKLTLDQKKTFKQSKQPSEGEISVFVNPAKQFQEFLGIGGAITDAAAEVFSTLSKDKQEELLSAYYSDDGINYNIIRTSIHSSDFGLGSHTYIEEGDKELKTFSIEKDKAKRIPMIKRAQAIIKEDMVFYASPWSPPAFMKTNNNMLQGGKLLPEFNQAWANYYVKFIEAYEAEGIPVWGVTVQNEPMAVQRWESCIYTAEEERDFLKNYLGPTFQNNELGDKNIVVWDHNRDLISHRANTIFEDPEALKYAWGIGFHWYETWAGGEPKYDNLQNIKASFPEMNLLFTEGCQEGFDATQYQRWSNAERYGNSMINDFNSGTVGWTDWNILLNEKGGPNHVNNFCFAPIHADTKTNELIYTPTYYYIGHFSKFIKKGALRVSTTTSRSTLESTSFQNPDGSIVTVVMNKTDDTIDYNLIVGDSEISLKIEPHAMQSVLY